LRMSILATSRIDRILGHLHGVHDRKLMLSPEQTRNNSSPKRPIKVLVTGAAGNIAYSIIFMIGQGQLLGPDQPVELRLLDLPVMDKAIQGLVMEVNDCAFPMLSAVVGTSDYKVAFTDVDIALLIGAKPRSGDMQRKELLTANAAIFKGQGKALNDFAARNVKVLVVGNPANTNCAITMANAPSLPRTSFTAMTRLDQNRAQSFLAARLGVSVDQVKNVVIWGNHSKTQFPDINHGLVAEYPTRGLYTPIRSAVNDDKWVQSGFLTEVQDRGAAIIQVRGKSSAASAAAAAIDHMKSWIFGTQEGEYVSMAVPSDGSYGIPKDIVYSFPCICRSGQYNIVQGLKIDDFSRSKMALTLKELEEEKKDAFSL